MNVRMVFAPETGNAGAEEKPAGGASLLTGGSETPPSSTSGEAPKLPFAWMTGLTGEQQKDAKLIERLAKFEKGIPDLSKAYVDLEAKLGKSISVPNDQASDEEKARYRAAIGVPEKPEDYQLEQTDLPKNVTVDEEMRKEFLKTAHAAGMTNDQINMVNKWYLGAVSKQIVGVEKLVKLTPAQAAEALRTELGDGYDAAMARKDRAFAHFATPELVERFDKTGFGNDPEVIKAWVKIGKEMGEHGFVDGNRGGALETPKVGERNDEQIAATLYPGKE